MPNLSSPVRGKCANSERPWAGRTRHNCHGAPSKRNPLALAAGSAYPWLVVEPRLISIDAAREFTTEHWPAHNRAQGIDWHQTDFALGTFEGPQCRGVAIYKVVGGMAYLEQLVVADGFTGRGIGTRLLEAFEGHARELGCHVIQLETAETQAPAFYARHGYQRIATWPDGRFHLDWHLYRKQIAE